MESRIVLFLAFAALTLFINTAMIFVAYKIFAKMTEKVEQSMAEFQKTMPIRPWLATLQSTSAQAVEVTGFVKDQIVGWEPSLARMQTAYTESLAKVDSRFGLLCRAVQFTAAASEFAVKWPIRKVNATTIGIQGIIGFFLRRQNDSAAGSRRNR